MPNWCYSHITVYSKDKEAVTDLHSRICSWLEAPTLMPDAWEGNSAWLGNMLLHAGFASEEVIDAKKIKCRGYIEDGPEDVYELAGYSCFCFTTETAWAAMIEMWYKLLDKLYPGKDIRIAYSANEPNMAQYYHWDPEKLFYPGEDYYIDYYLDEIPGLDAMQNVQCLMDDSNDGSDYISTEAAIRLMQQILSTTETDEYTLLSMLDDYNEKLEELNGDAYIHFYKYDNCRTENG